MMIWTMGWVWAQALAGAPATVLEHDVTVTVDGAQRLRQSVTWSIRIDDPKAVTAGIIAPPGLDGAVDGDALVLEDVLVVPEGVEKGTVYTLSASTRDDNRRPHSGLFLTAPDLPTEQARLVVKAPSWQPMTVWSDPAGKPTYGSGGTRTATIEWHDLAPNQMGQAAWSTWKDWLDAGAQIDKTIDGKLVNKAGLGPTLGGAIEGASIGLLTDDAYQYVSLTEGPLGRWEDAKPAPDSLRERTGTAVDRGVVLLSMFRAAGYEARPAYYRPADARGDIPITVPAPAVVDRPVVKVIDKKGNTVWIDPGTDAVAVPDMPARMVGSTVWVPGDLPTRLTSADVVAGAVVINTDMTIGLDGSITWISGILTDGAAKEAFRLLLAPQDEAGRSQSLNGLINKARPGTERFTLRQSGVEKARKELSLQINGHQDGVFTPLGPGMQGTIPPTLGPALAGWLPPRIRVEEHISVKTPPNLRIVAVNVPPPAYSNDAMVSRHFRDEGNRALLLSESERPYSVTTPGRDKRANEFLLEQAQLGTKLVLFGTVDPTVIKAVQNSDLPDAEKVAMEAVLWLSENVPPKAQKALKKGLWAGLPNVADELDRLVRYGDPRPWETLLKISKKLPEYEVRVARSMADNGLKQQGWVAAASIDYSATYGNDAPPAAVRIEQLLFMDRVQPAEKPEDPDLAKLWVEPAELIAEAVALAPDDARVLIRQGELALADDKATDAEVLFEKAIKNSKDPGTRAVATVRLAQAGAKNGVASRQIAERIRKAVDEVPFSADVSAAAAQAMVDVGEHTLALQYALSSARLAYGDPDRWDQVVTFALNAGELPIALYAARRASDLTPTDAVRGKQLGQLATMAGDEEAAKRGLDRAGEKLPKKFPPSLDDLIGQLPPEYLLALLQFHDDAVVDSPIYLEMRAQMRVDRGLLDDAARDGVLLANRHGMASGTAMAFAATAGRLWSTSALKTLDAAASEDLVARTTRMEYRLVTNSGDPMADARALAADGDPRAKMIVQGYDKPAELAKQLEAWPADISNPSGTPPSGFKTNRALSKATGVVAWSDPSRGLAVLKVGAFAGVLPPPLGNLYTPFDQPVMTLENGAQVIRLDGGVIPVYAAVGTWEGGEMIGLGYAPEAAATALGHALE